MNTSARPTVVHVVNSLEGGGTERNLVTLLRAFDHSVRRHVVVTLRSAGAMATMLPDSVSCHALGIVGRSRTAFLRLGSILRHYRSDVLHARNTGCWWDATVAAMSSRTTKLVLGFHGLEHGGGFGKRQIMGMRFASMLGGRFATVSASGRNQLQSQGHVARCRITVVHNGVNRELFGPLNPTIRRDARSALRVPDGTFLVGVVGTLSPVKRVDLVIDAVASAVSSGANARLLIVGDGPLRSELERHALGIGASNRVQFMGGREDVAELLGCMDVFVSASESEGMSNAILEAMAVGLPVIATDVGDNASVIDHQVDGLTVGADVRGELASALLQLARSPELGARLGSAARSKTEGFTMEDVVAKYEEFYERLAPARVRGRDTFRSYIPRLADYAHGPVGPGHPMVR